MCTCSVQDEVNHQFEHFSFTDQFYLVFFALCLPKGQVFGVYRSFSCRCLRVIHDLERVICCSIVVVI